MTFYEQAMEQCIRQNNAIEIYEGYFETTDDATRADIIFFTEKVSGIVLIYLAITFYIAFFFLPQNIYSVEKRK